MDKVVLKNGARKIMVDCASVIIFLMVCVNFLSGCGTLYKSFYETGRLPTPEVFTAASYAFATGTSFVYMLLLTRKYRRPEKPCSKGGS